ncbi:MAG: orotidine-5'-phosphate decarboxylase [Acidimicrobiales bacterium]
MTGDAPDARGVGPPGQHAPGLSQRSFVERVAEATASRGPLVLGLDPSAAVLRSWGLPGSAEGLARFADLALEASVGAVGIVKPQSAFYERHGWRGIRVLARLVADLRSAGVLVVLDGKRGDVGSTSEAYALAYLGPDAGIPVDALTVVAYMGLGALRPLVERAHLVGGGLFVVARSTNPEGRALQGALAGDGRSVERLVVDAISDENRRVAPGGLGPVGAVVGPTHAPPSGLDLPGMNGLFLAPGVGAQGATVEDVAACFARCRDRVLPSASRSLLALGPDVARLREGTAELAAAFAEALR